MKKYTEFETSNFHPMVENSKFCWKKKNRVIWVTVYSYGCKNTMAAMNL